MQNIERRIVISTTDPRNQGGVWGVTEALVKGLSRLGYRDIQLVYPSPRKSITEVTSEDVLGYEGIAFPFKPAFGNPYFSHFASNYNLRRRLIQPGSINIAVGGGNQCAMPFLLANAKYYLWVSNTVDDEYHQLYLGRANKFDIKKIITYRLIRPTTRLIERHIFEKSELTFVESMYSLNLIKDSYAIAPEKLAYLPFPIDAKLSVTEPPIIPGKYALFVGRVDDLRKNVALLIKAFSLIDDPSLKLVLVGAVDEGGPAVQLVAQLALSERVTFLGFVSNKDLNNILSYAHVFAMPSLQEGLGNAVVEALSHAVPVVATRCGGVEDSVHDGENGFLVDINDAVAMADRIARICASPDLRDRLAQGARRHITQIHSWDRFTDILKRRLLEHF